MLSQEERTKAGAEPAVRAGVPLEGGWGKFPEQEFAQREEWQRFVARTTETGVRSQKAARVCLRTAGDVGTKEGAPEWVCVCPGVGVRMPSWMGAHCSSPSPAPRAPTTGQERASVAVFLRPRETGSSKAAEPVGELRIWVQE